MSELNYNPDEDYVPKRSQREYENAFRATPYYERWIIFSRLLQGHPFIKDYLSRRQEGKCIFCGKKLFEDMNYNIVHHRDYMNICSLHESKASLIREPKPTQKKPNRTIPVPNCEYCKRHKESDFNDCVSRLVIMHDNCHTMLHYTEQARMAWKPIKYMRNQYDVRSQNPITAKKKRIRNAPLCKKCGAKMVLKNGKYGQFFGCPDYPLCTYTEPT